MKNLMQVNPEHVQLRDQGLRVATVSIAGPALVYAGYRFPGSMAARGLLVALGAALVYTNYCTFAEAREEEEEEEGEDEILLGLAAG